MFYRCLPYWILLAFALAMPQGRTHGDDAVSTVPKVANAAPTADDPAAVEAFKKAERYRYCQRDEAGNVISIKWNWPRRFERPETHQLRLRCLENLKGFPKLRLISLHTDNPNEELDYIGDLDKLETLEIHNTELNNDGLAAIQGMARLKRLSLNTNYNVTDAGLEHVAALKSLEDLDLSNTSVRGNGLSWLKGLKSLKKLDLGGTNLHDAEMVHVAALASLEELNIRFTEITSASIHELSRLRRLKLLDLSSTVGTQAGADELKKSLPNLKIILPQPPRRAHKRQTRNNP
jgi:Leucine-rich repeat (LRR) protein